MMYFIIFILFFSFYGFTNYLISKHILLWLQLIIPNINSLVFYIIYGLFASTILFGFLPALFNLSIPPAISRPMGIISDYWMGIYCYLFLLLILTKIILLIGNLTKLIPSPLSSQTILVTGFIVFASIIFLLTYGVYNATHIKKAYYEVKIDKKSSLEKLNIVLISDLHLGFTNGNKHLAKIIDTVNSLNPDIVCITGDIFNGDYHALKDPEKAVKLFNNIKSKYGVYGSLGNHDAGNSFEEMKNFFRKSNIKMLNDESAIIDDLFIMIGRKDSSPIGNQGMIRRNINVIYENLDKEMPVIVMDHQPGNIREYGKEVDLVLGGHTHKGQIFPFGYITKAIYDVDYGYYWKGKNNPQVVVTSGAGTWGPPLRIASNNEVVSINLKFNKESN